MNKEEFANPGQDYRGVTLWMLNDLLEESEIERQLSTFADAGWGALITRTFNGLRTEYLSEEWHAMVERIIETARKHSVKVWLQAGHMPAAVPELPEEEQHRVLVVRNAPASPAPEETLLLERDGKAYFARRKEHVVDLLDPASCRRYVQEAYDQPMAERYGAEMGKVVETVWVDEPHFNPPELPWSTRIPPRFRELWGYDIVEHLPSLLGEAGDFRKVRHHFWRTVLQMLMESYFENVSRWCEEHNVLFSGHLMGEDTLQGQISWSAAAMPLYEYMGLPGIDHLTRSLHWPAELPFIITPKQCSSAANQLGKGRSLAEMYAVSSQGISFRDRKRIGEWIMMLGINYRCYHGSFYSLRGRRKRIYAPHLSFQQPWWPENRMMADYFARLSYLMRQGAYAADVLVLHPLESAYCVYDSSGVDNPYERIHEPAAVREYTESLIRVSENLLRVHYGFEYGDETLMAAHGAVRGSRIAVGSASYRLVLLPPTLTIRETTFALLSELKEQGGTIVVVERAPVRIDGELDGRTAGLFEGVEVVENSADAIGLVLDEALDRMVEISAGCGADAGRLWLHERTTDAGRMIALTNPHDERIDVRIRVDAEGTLERWDLETGATSVPSQHRDGGATSTELTLWPDGSAVYLFREGFQAAVDAPRMRPVRGTHLAADYKVSRLSPNLLTLDFCSYRTDGEWSELMPVSAVQESLADRDYRGDVSLRFAFDLRDIPESISLVIEDADECSVSVNGTEVPYRGAEYFVDPCFMPIDISQALQSGLNRIEISRSFEPPAQPKFRLGGLFQTASGVELEAVYLIGSFAVHGSQAGGPAKPGAVRFSPRFSIGAESGRSDGELLFAGYPFFAGKLRLQQRLHLARPAANERVFIRFDRIDSAFAAVYINGTRCGHLAWAPYEADITGSVKDGENLIEIELATSLRNMLGPHHRPSGEPDQVWADGWTGLATERRRDTKLSSGPDWWQNRNRWEVFWTDDYFQIPFGVSGGVVEYRRTDPARRRELHGQEDVSGNRTIRDRA